MSYSSFQKVMTGGARREGELSIKIRGLVLRPCKLLLSAIESDVEWPGTGIDFLKRTGASNRGRETPTRTDVYEIMDGKEN